jgi:alginate O-acetyltransferase complex protein AlgI
LSLVANLGVLGVFKYFDFFNGVLTQLFAAEGMRYPIANLNLILPIGLSFHTFQSMAYTIEIYKGRWQPERHLGRYAL